MVFALDASSSIWEYDFQRQLRFLKDMVGVLDVSPQHTHVGVLTFGTEIRRQFHLTDYVTQDDVINAIGHVRQSQGNTNTAGALHALRRHMFSSAHARTGVAKVGIVITDGRSDNQHATAKQAAKARAAGIQLFAIGVGSGVDTKELYAIASQPKERHVFEVDTYEALASIRDLLAIETCVGKYGKVNSLVPTVMTSEQPELNNTKLNLKRLLHTFLLNFITDKWDLKIMLFHISCFLFQSLPPHQPQQQQRQQQPQQQRLHRHPLVS